MALFCATVPQLFPPSRSTCYLNTIPVPFYVLLLLLLFSFFLSPREGEKKGCHVTNKNNLRPGSYKVQIALGLHLLSSRIAASVRPWRACFLSDRGCWLGQESSYQHRHEPLLGKYLCDNDDHHWHLCLTASSCNMVLDDPSMLQGWHLPEFETLFFGAESWLLKQSDEEHLDHDSRSKRP